MDDVIVSKSIKKRSRMKSMFTLRCMFPLRKNIPVTQDMSTLRKCMYGIGGIPCLMLSNSVSFYINIFLLEVALMSPYHIPYVSLLSRVWDAITDPLVGALVSITHTRWGNLKPYILSAMPVMCLSYFFLFFNANISNNFSKVVFYVFMNLVYQTATTFYYIPYGTMCMVLTSDVVVRDQLTAYRIVFEIIGLLLGSSLFGGIITIYRPSSKCGNTTLIILPISEQESGYMIASGVNIIITVVCVFITVFGSIEKVFFKDNLSFDFAFYLKILSFKPYAVLMFTFACTSIGMMFVQSNMALYIIYVLKMEKIMPIGILIMMTCSILLIPVAMFMIGKFGKKITYFSGMVSIVPILLSLLFLPSQLNIGIFYAIMVCAGFPVMISFLLPWSMLPDCIDNFTLIHDVRKDAAFYSLFGFFQKFALGFSVGMTGILLGYAKYDQKLCEQPESVARALRYLIGIGSTLFFVVSMISIYFYPINESKRVEIQYQLKKRSLEKYELDSTRLNYLVDKL